MKLKQYPTKSLTSRIVMKGKMLKFSSIRDITSIQKKKERQLLAERRKVIPPEPESPSKFIQLQNTAHNIFLYIFDRVKKR